MFSLYGHKAVSSSLKMGTLYDRANWRSETVKDRYSVENYVYYVYIDGASFSALPYIIHGKHLQGNEPPEVYLIWRQRIHSAKFY